MLVPIKISNEGQVVKFLNRMNGWQRIWFVLTAASLLFLGIIYPYFEIYSFNYSSFEYREKVKKDLSASVCSNYINKPMSQLIEPSFSSEGGNCWHLYTTRRYDEIDTYPYSLATYDNKESNRLLRQYLALSGIFGAGILFASAMLYFIGVLFAWIRRGFVRTT